MSSRTHQVNPRAIPSIMRQLHRLKMTPSPHISLISTPAEYALIKAEISGPEATPFAGGKFSLQLRIPASFPDSPPDASFSTPIFHPNVSPLGKICPGVLKNFWDPKKWDFGLFLEALRKMLAAPFPSSPLNDEAAKMLQEDYPAYLGRAKLMTRMHGAGEGRNSGPLANLGSANGRDGKDRQRSRDIEKMARGRVPRVLGGEERERRDRIEDREDSEDRRYRIDVLRQKKRIKWLRRI